MHVGPQFEIEDIGERIDAVVQALRFRKVVAFDGSVQGHLQIGNNAAAPGKEAVASKHERTEEPCAVRSQYVHRRDRFCNVRTCHSCC